MKNNPSVRLQLLLGVILLCAIGGWLTRRVLDSSTSDESVSPPISASAPATTGTDRRDTESYDEIVVFGIGPEEVVRRQLEAARKSRDNPQALIECYAYASPENKKAVGSFENFNKLIHSEVFLPFVTHSEAIIGTPVVNGSLATVLVTLVRDQQRPATYRFFLSQKNVVPYTESWMTDGVAPENLELIKP